MGRTWSGSPAEGGWCYALRCWSHYIGYCQLLVRAYIYGMEGSIRIGTLLLPLSAQREHLIARASRALSLGSRSPSAASLILARPFAPPALPLVAARPRRCDDVRVCKPTYMYVGVGCSAPWGASLPGVTSESVGVDRGDRRRGVCGPSEGGVGGGAAAPPSAPGEGGGLASAPSRGSTPRDGLPPLGPLWLGSEVTHFLLPIAISVTTSVTPAASCG